jgi:hypothetical protein
MSCQAGQARAARGMVSVANIVKKASKKTQRIMNGFLSRYFIRPQDGG